MKLYTVEEGYVQHLKGIDTRVADNYSGKRAYVGIVLQVGTTDYLAPLTSYKPKQDNFDSTSPLLFKVHEKGDPNNKLGMLQLNNMIPLVSGSYQLLNIAAEPARYRRMVMLQLAFINSHQDVIKERAAKLYELVTVERHRHFCRLSCDFKALEAGMGNYGPLLAPVPAATAIVMPAPTPTPTLELDLPTPAVTGQTGRPILTLKPKLPTADGPSETS